MPGLGRTIFKIHIIRILRLLGVDHEYVTSRIPIPQQAPDVRETLSTCSNALCPVPPSTTVWGRHGGGVSFDLKMAPLGLKLWRIQAGHSLLNPRNPCYCIRILLGDGVERLRLRALYHLRFNVTGELFYCPWKLNVIFECGYPCELCEYLFYFKWVLLRLIPIRRREAGRGGAGVNRASYELVNELFCPVLWCPYLFWGL